MCIYNLEKFEKITNKTLLIKKLNIQKNRCDILCVICKKQNYYSCKLQIFFLFVIYIFPFFLFTITLLSSFISLFITTITAPPPPQQPQPSQCCHHHIVKREEYYQIKKLFPYTNCWNKIFLCFGESLSITYN